MSHIVPDAELTSDNRKRARYDSGEDLIDPSDLFSSSAGSPFATSMGGMGGMNMGFSPEFLFNVMHSDGGAGFSFGSSGTSPFGAGGSPFGASAAAGGGGPFGSSGTAGGGGGGTRGRNSSARGFPPGGFPF